MLVGPNISETNIAVDGSGGMIRVRTGYNVPSRNPAVFDGVGYRGWVIEVSEVSQTGRLGRLAYRGLSWLVACMAIRDLAGEMGGSVHYSRLEELAVDLFERREAA